MSDVEAFSFSRWGGLSSAPYDELNTGFNTGDTRENVRYNRQIIKERLGLKLLASVGQVHGDRIRVVGSLERDSEFDGFDGLLTRARGTGLLIQHADCQAVVLYDPVTGAVGNIHCGWRGSVKGILSRAVSLMGGVFGSRPGDIHAAVGPSIGPCCMEFRGWRDVLPASMHGFRVRGDHMDFWSVTAEQLRAAGLPSEQIEITGICTACSTDCFSYRREKDTGRLGTVIFRRS